ncbi:MAG: type II toxin-antitoxin system antitoxin SocA domain-containing protein [Promethearchaeota archaeon]
MDTFYKSLGNKLKQLRQNVGLSQKQFSDLLNINRVAVSQIESGTRKITAEEITKIAKVFNISTDDLLNPIKKIKIVFDRTKEKTPTKEEIRINVPQKNLKKFKEVLLYILNKVGSKPNIGETVLYKILYFIDFDYYEKYEEQLIGATYQKNHYGPTPKEFIKIVAQMEGKDLVKVQGKYFKHPQTKYLPLRDPELSILNAKEIHLIDQVISRLTDMNAKQISEYSHGDVPWLTTEDGDIIEYESVFYRTNPYSVRD